MSYNTLGLRRVVSIIGGEDSRESCTVGDVLARPYKDLDCWPLSVHTGPVDRCGAGSLSCILYHLQKRGIT